ncbi:MAG: hypothetical protein EOM05_09180 [Clostridia bacterium]|nr:hypothetical protein [Clostridia bacterium]
MKRLLSFVLTIILMCVISFPAAGADVSSINENTTTQIHINDLLNNREFLTNAVINEQNGVLTLSRDTTVCASFKKTLIKNETIFILPSTDSSINEVRSEIENNIYNTRSTGSQTEEERDAARGIKGIITIYYERTQEDGVSMAKVTSCSGSVVREDRSMSCTRQQITVGSTGLASGGFKTQNVSFEKTAYSWYYTTPTSWVPVLTGLTSSVIGATCIYTVKRAGNSHTWTFEVNNNL